MPTATITSKGQITIPKAIRAALGLSTGDRVTLRMRADGIVELTREAVALDVREVAETQTALLEKLPAVAERKVEDP